MREESREIFKISNVVTNLFTDLFSFSVKVLFPSSDALFLRGNFYILSSFVYLFLSLFLVICSHDSPVVSILLIRLSTGSPNLMAKFDLKEIF